MVVFCEKTVPADHPPSRGEETAYVGVGYHLTNSVAVMVESIPLNKRTPIMLEARWY